jgi:hypothetical protein
MSYQLCTTCTVESNCRYAPGRTSVFLCEEFEGARPSPQRSDTPDPADPPSPTGSLTGGLCGNCAHDADCVFPRPAGGMLTCREYK